MTNRVGGPNPGEPKGPDVRSQEQHRRIEKVEKVRAVDEAENEQRTRKKFQSFMDEEETPEKPRTPSPFETNFYQGEKTKEAPALDGMIGSSPSLSEALDNSVVASPNYSSPPDVTILPEAEDDESPPLPRSHDFWQNVDSPPDQPTRNPTFQEVNKSEHSKKREEKTRIEKKRKEELINPTIKEKESLYGPPGKTAQDKKEKAIAEKEKHARELPEKKKKTPPPFIQGQAEPVPRKDRETFPQTKKEKEDRLLPSTIHTDVQAAQVEKRMHKDKEDGEKNENRGSKPIEITSSTSNTLPATIIPLAQAATTQASPILSPQTMPLFFQMVGTIYVMAATPGVSKTEILLNSPGFAGSKFFGATISIEKYATAPDSLNIRLTGSDEAVKSFNENITNLYGAFQNGNFNFRIGRISAEYSIEKPVFRRKESGEDKGSSDFSDKRGRK